jgi:peptidoglycan/LPS O-acetylase OafA/YrhL
MTMPPDNTPMDPESVTTEPPPHERTPLHVGMPVQTTGVDGSPENPADGSSDQRLTYVPALDGIRAVSIIGVMFNHSGLSVGAGGFIGVSVFFVLSGFLITSLLVKEWARSGTVSLKRFWARRARRLLPALLVLLVAVALYAWLLAPPDTRGSLRIDAIASLFYFGNWHQIIAGQSYFAQAAVESPLLHTWSLAIEEQFYLIWPLIVLGMLKWWRRRGPLLVLAVVGALASAAEMFFLYHPGVDPSRLYYGTDTRAQDLLVGAVVAIVLSTRRPATSRQSRYRYSALTLVAALAFGVVWSRLNESSAFPYRGGFLLADVLAALVILGVVQAPRELVARVLSWRPLTYLGQISYGLYLWHLPVFLVLNQARVGLTGWPLFGVRSAVSFAFAVGSAKLVEIPIRRGALRSWRAWLATPLAVGATAGVLLLATTAVPAVALPVNGSTGLTGTQTQQLVATKAFTTNPIRFMLFGDSVALTLGFGLSYRSQPTWGVAFNDQTTLGCNLDPRAPIQADGVVGHEPVTTCADWRQTFARAVDKYRPQVVGLELGRWETLNIKYQGTWTHVGEPLWDNHLRSELNQAVAIFSAHGAKVLLFTMPYVSPPEAPDGAIYPENQPSRVDAYNALIRSVAAAHSGVVEVNDLNKELDPQGHFTSTINGVPVRWSDGVHVALSGGELIRPQVLPQIVSLGLAARSG